VHDGGYVKIYRKIKKWEWYKDGNTLRVFLHLLLSANYAPSKYKGHDVGVGSLVTGISAIGRELGISFQQTRTALEHLKSTGEITIKPTNKFSIISLTHFADYQNAEAEDNKQNNKQLTNNQQTTNKQLTTSKEYKEYKNIRNIKEKEINKEKERQSAKPPRRKYGEYQHVLLTDQQYEKLKAEFGEEATAKYIRKVDEYCQQYGKKYSDYNLTIRNWMRGDGVAKAPDLKYTFEDDSEKYFGS
jgi:hypothetical protein